MNLTTIRSELVEQLASISGLNVASRPPAVLQPPHAYIDVIRTIEPSQSFEGLVRLEFEVIVMVSLADDDNGWNLLSNYCGTATGSLDNALNTNSQLDSTVMFIDPVRCEDVGDVREYGTLDYRSCLARIVVHSL